MNYRCVIKHKIYMQRRIHLREEHLGAFRAGHPWKLLPLGEGHFPGMLYAAHVFLMGALAIRSVITRVAVVENAVCNANYMSRQ